MSLNAALPLTSHSSKRATNPDTPSLPHLRIGGQACRRFSRRPWLPRCHRPWLPRCLRPWLPRWPVGHGCRDGPSAMAAEMGCQRFGASLSLVRGKGTRRPTLAVGAPGSGESAGSVPLLELEVIGYTAITFVSGAAFSLWLFALVVRSALSLGLAARATSLVDCNPRSTSAYGATMRRDPRS